jgi:hypothetical protein
MTPETPTPTAPRTWQTVAKERGLSLRILGEMVGRPHSTMLAYSCGKRRMPQPLRDRLSTIFGEAVA